MNAVHVRHHMRHCQAICHIITATSVISTIKVARFALIPLFLLLNHMEFPTISTSPSLATIQRPSIFFVACHAG